jgi:hypothetical protein
MSRRHRERADHRRSNVRGARQTYRQSATHGYRRKSGRRSRIADISVDAHAVSRMAFHYPGDWGGGNALAASPSPGGSEAFDRRP